MTSAAKKAVKVTSKISNYDDNKSIIKELAMEASRHGKNNEKSVDNINLNQILNEQIQMEKIVGGGENSDSELLDNMSEINDNNSVNNYSGSEGEKYEGEKQGEDLSNEFKENVVKYIKCDDLIRKKKEEIKVLTNDKKPCEEFIMKYLDTKEATHVNVSGGKLVKNVSESRKALKVEIIKESILEGIKDEQINKEDIANNDIALKIIGIMDGKREKTIRVKLKRSFVKK